MLHRERTEENERLILSERACLSADSRGRARPEEQEALRTCFQRDVDRIIHSKAFRRLKHKTQVFLRPEGGSLPHPDDPHPWRWTGLPGPSPGGCGSTRT